MKKSYQFILVMLLFAIASRFLLIPNFTAIGAIALLSGGLMKNKILAILSPLTILVISDMILNTFIYHMDSLLYVGALYVYVPILLITIMSNYVKNLNVSKYIGLSLISTIIFFLVSNFGVWQTGFMYPHNIGGLLACYIAAIPFALSYLTSTLIYGGVISLVGKRFELYQTLAYK